MSAREGRDPLPSSDLCCPLLVHTAFLFVQGPSRPCWFLRTKPRALNFQMGGKQSPSALSLQPPALPAPSGSAS